MSIPMIRGVATHGEATSPVVREAHFFEDQPNPSLTQSMETRTPNHRSMRGSERRSVTNATLEVNNTKNARHHD